MSKTNKTDIINDLVDQIGARDTGIFLGEFIRNVGKTDTDIDTADLKKANQEFKSHIEYLTRENERLKGEINGLRFAIRCNGVCGNEVTE